MASDVRVVDIGMRGLYEKVESSIESFRARIDDTHLGTEISNAVLKTVMSACISESSSL